LDDLLNKTIKDITFSFNSFNEAEKLKKIEILGGETTVKIYIQQNNEIFRFNLKNKRKINNKLLNTLDLLENVIVE